MEKKFDVLVVGELNIDLILDGIQSFPEVGKEKLAEKMTLALGSSSAIFASNIASLGARVAFLGKVGKDKFGEMVLEELSKRKLDISMIVSDPNLATGITVVLNVEEDRANITYPGAMDHLTPDDIPDEALICSSHLHFSSCFLQAGMRKSVGRLFQRAKQYGLTTSFDMQWDPFEQWDLDMPGTLPYVDIFLPNEQKRGGCHWCRRQFQRRFCVQIHTGERTGRVPAVREPDRGRFNHRGRRDGRFLRLSEIPGKGAGIRSQPLTPFYMFLKRKSHSVLTASTGDKTDMVKRIAGDKV